MMFLRRKGLVLILLAIMLTASLGGLVSPVRAFVQEDLAVVLVIDVSGSMAYTDPGRLRETAASIFIDLLGAGDYLSVITFATETEVLFPLLEVGGWENKERIKEDLGSRLDPRGATDFVGALS
ncbi:MAG TPA: VWA domain-containing protein, partial [Firmicutes bacterium]|nr:VWA domain-containing protein [Bacillota bacterium]